MVFCKDVRLVCSPSPSVSLLSESEWFISCATLPNSTSLIAFTFFEIQTTPTLASRKPSRLLLCLVCGFLIFFKHFVYCACMHAQGWREARVPRQLPVEVRVNFQLADGFGFYHTGYGSGMQSQACPEAFLDHLAGVLLGLLSTPSNPASLFVSTRYCRLTLYFFLS